MSTLVIAVGFELALLAVAIAGALALGRGIPGPLGIDGWLALTPLLVLPPLAAVPLVLQSRRRGPRAIIRAIDAWLGEWIRSAPKWHFVVVSLVAGVGEEALFRGVVQAEVTVHVGPVVGLAVASLLFGLAHAVTPGYVLLASLMGAYLGGAFALTGNLAVPIAVHALYDWVALLLLRRHFRAGNRDAAAAPTAHPAV